MLKKSLIIQFFIFVIAIPIAFAGTQEQKSNNDLRQNEMEKSIFMLSGAQTRVLKIGLIDCMLYALKKNSDILIKRIDPKLKANDQRVAEADFEPAFNTDFTYSDNTVLASSRLQGSDVYNTHDINLNANIAGKIVTGTQYKFDFLNQRYKSDSSYQIYNPYYDIEPKITLTQPLLRGFGILVNRADIIIAQNNMQESEKSFKDTVIATISSAKSAYYNYIFALENYKIDKLALERVYDLLAIDKARYQKGLISSVALLETEASAAQKEKALLTSEAAVKLAEDELKLVTNIVDDPESWNATIELLDKPEFKEEEVDLLKCLNDAFKFRPDYESALIDLKSRDVRIKVAKNALLPTLDLSGSLGLNGLGKDYENALQKTNANYPDWGLGLKVSVPWGGAERAEFDQKKLEKAQALLSLKKLEHDIILDVRDKVRMAKTQARQVLVAKISKEKEEQNYAAQKERFGSGEVSTHDMLDYQDKLSSAQLDYIKALIDYNIAIINLDKSRGVTLARNNIKLEE